MIAPPFFFLKKSIRSKGVAFILLRGQWVMDSFQMRDSLLKKEDSIGRSINHIIYIVFVYILMVCVTIIKFI